MTPENLSKPEPAPTPNDKRAVWDLVVHDMKERDAEGRRKYGTRLQPHNGRKPLVDAYQEALDLVVYLRQEIAEADERGETKERLEDRIEALQREVRHLDASRTRLATDALAALSAFVATPEKGYLVEPHCLSGDIEKLGRERDKAVHHLESIQAAFDFEIGPPIDSIPGLIVHLRKANAATCADATATEGKLEKVMKERDELKAELEQVNGLIRYHDIAEERDSARVFIKQLEAKLREVHAELAAKTRALKETEAAGEAIRQKNARLLELKEGAEAQHASALARALELERAKDAAYSERNQVVALLARLAVALSWRAGVGQHEGEPWEPDWRTIVFIDLPIGQVSWHFHDSERHLLDGLPAYAGRWDGHTTAEKYIRVNAYLVRAPHVAP